MTGTLLLAVEDSRVNPGLLGFLVVALLGAATWLLIRSMTRQMRKIDFTELDRTDGAPRAPGETFSHPDPADAPDPGEARPEP